jgi:hypothetical protein
LVQGLGQQKSVNAQTSSDNENQFPEAIDRLNEGNGAGSDNASVAKRADTVTSVDLAAARSAQPNADADASLTRPESMPAALFLPSVDRLSLLDRAYLDAYTILRADNNCSRFYGGPRVIEVLNELKKQLRTTTLDTSIAVRMSGLTTSVTSLKYGFSYRLFDKAELNVRGSFFHGNTFRHDQTVPMIGSFSPNTREARVTILLHELAHLIEKARSAWLLPNDGNNGALSQRNTLQIIAVCGEQIRGINNNSFEAELQAARPAPDAVVQANLKQ